MTYKHCSIVRDFFLFLFSNHRGFVKESLKFLPFNHIFYTILEEQPHMAVIFNHAPQLLLANTKVDGCLGHGQGILLTNSHFVLTQSLSSFPFRISISVPYLIRPRENPIFSFQASRVQFAASVKIVEKTDIGCLGYGCRKRGRKSNEFSTYFARPLGVSLRLGAAAPVSTR